MEDRSEVKSDKPSSKSQPKAGGDASVVPAEEHMDPSSIGNDGDRVHVVQRTAKETNTTQTESSRNKLPEPTVNPVAPENDDGIVSLVLPNLCEGLEETFSEKSFTFKDLAILYKAKKYNRKAKKRLSSGNTEEALNLFEKSAKHGSSDALFNMGLCYEMGHGSVTMDLDKAAVHYAQAAKKDHKDAIYNLALMHQNGKVNTDDEQTNTREAITLLKQAAELGLAKAATSLGAIYAEKLQMEEAGKWFELAASGCNGKDKEDGIGTLFLGHTYNEGDGRDKDCKKAKELYGKAVKLMKEHKQDSTVQFFLGMCYEHGWGLSKSDRIARVYYNKSEHPDSGNRLKYTSEEDTSSETSSDSSLSGGRINSRKRRNKSIDQQVPGNGDGSSDDDFICFSEDVDAYKADEKLSAPPVKKLMEYRSLSIDDTSSSASDAISSWGSQSFDP